MPPECMDSGRCGLSSEFLFHLLRLQEMAALTVSKMPAPEAEQVVERLAGVKISAATLARQAKQQGQRAEQKRQELDQQMSRPEGRAQQDKDLQLQLALEPLPWCWNWTHGTFGSETIGAGARSCASGAKSRRAGIGRTGAPVFG